MVTKELKDIFDLALKDVKVRKQDLVTVEHLMYAMLSDKSILEFMKSVGADVKTIKDKLITIIDSYPHYEDFSGYVEESLSVNRILQSSYVLAHMSGRVDVAPLDVLVAIFTEPSQACSILTKESISQQQVKDYVAKRKGTESDKSSNEDAEKDTSKNPLKSFTINLIEKAQQGKIDPLVGRENELARIIHVLARRRKNNPVLVGEAGVGKTAIVEGLALAVSQGKVPKCLIGAELYSLDTGSLVAGTKFRGDFEARIKDIVKALKERPNAILFVDEIHTLIGAGRVSDGGALDAANILKPALSSGDIRCIGATTYKEYQGSFEKDKAFSRRFQKIEVCEPSVEETVKILEGLKSQYEQHHGVGYTASAVRLSAELAAKYINDRFLPDKAIDVLDESGAAKKLEITTKKRIVRNQDVEKVVARIARIPEATVSATETVKLSDLEDDLGKVIFGQDAAIKALSTVVKISRAGLGCETKPQGVFLFAGPTGTGKTATALALSEALGAKLIRFDMSEFNERHTVSRLLGAPAGYVGHETSGAVLTDQVLKHPRCVLLLDEIEKAHPDVFNILLQIFDHATISDNNGRKADFRQSIIIMTTNAGAAEMSAPSIGFGGGLKAKDGQAAITKLFTPEFRNRLSSIITFSRLGSDVISKIAQKSINELLMPLKAKKVILTITKSAVAWFAKNGYDECFGARPMARLVENTLKLPIANELLFGKLKNGGEVIVDETNDKIVLDYVAAEARVKVLA